jgi:hypothetical protein
MVRNCRFFNICTTTFSLNYFLNGNHLLPTLFIKIAGISFKLKLRKIVSKNVVQLRLTDIENSSKAAPDQLKIPLNKLPWP